MHKEPETLGEILKTARMRADITMETLAERVDITERYLYRIENEGKKPSFDVLYKLIRELAISSRNTLNFSLISDASSNEPMTPIRKSSAYLQ